MFLKKKCLFYVPGRLFWQGCCRRFLASAKAIKLDHDVSVACVCPQKFGNGMEDMFYRFQTLQLVLTQIVGCGE